jgi:hypothetical protein
MNQSVRSPFLEFAHADALTSEPEDRFVRKLSKALCALLISPELSAEPISESSLENDVLLELVDVSLVDVLLVVLLSVEFSRLVSES